MSGFVHSDDKFAFPLLDNHGDGYGGMTLRDYFAGQAMAGLCCELNWKGDDIDLEGMANDAYRLADAMLKVRDKK